MVGIRIDGEGLAFAGVFDHRPVGADGAARAGGSGERIGDRPEAYLDGLVGLNIGEGEGGSAALDHLTIDRPLADRVVGIRIDGEGLAFAGVFDHRPAGADSAARTGGSGERIGERPEAYLDGLVGLNVGEGEGGSAALGHLTIDQPLVDRAVGIRTGRETLALAGVFDDTASRQHRAPLRGRYDESVCNRGYRSAIRNREAVWAFGKR